MPSITSDLAAAISAARALDCPVCPALAGDECVYSTAPVSVPVAPGTPMRPVRGYHAGRLALAGHPVPGLPSAAIVWDSGGQPRQPDEADGIGGEIDATAGALLSGRITALREYVGRALGDDRHDRAEALGRVAAELERISVILAAATEGDDDEDDAEPYCTACGAWVGLFHAVAGWRHFRGKGTSASPVVLYDAGHEPAVAWTVPPGRALSPADIGIIRQALADAAAWRSWRAEGANCEDCQRLDPGRCAEHASDSERAAAYEALMLRPLAGEAAVAP
ncbi:MAG: hypothetical protein ACRDRJ_15150 [Streptosporangiaceae bacterium]